MPALRRGITRTVILTRRRAYKFPSLRAHGDGLAGLLWSWTRGVQANLSEREWSGSPGTCPVLWSMAGLVNAYPRAAEVPANTEDVIDFDAIGFLGPADRKAPNIGWLNDGPGGSPRLVFIDYDMSWNDTAPCQPRREVR